MSTTTSAHFTHDPTSNARPGTIPIATSFVEEHRHLHLLIVEDDNSVRTYLADSLSSAGFDVDCAATVNDAYHLVSTTSYDLVLLDILLPEGSGFDICRTLRKSFSTPIIFMSCLDDSDSIVHAFDLGGDDYIVKPFEIEVLIARINANIRRASGLARNRDIQHLDFAGFSLDCINHCVVRNGTQIPLTALEFQILYFLATNPNRYFSTDDIYTAVWGKDSYGDARTVSVHVCSIRKKIEQDPSQPQYLKRQRGFGYIFLPE